MTAKIVTIFYEKCCVYVKSTEHYSAQSSVLDPVRLMFGLMYYRNG
jgi:hypothetical protein